MSRTLGTEHRQDGPEAFVQIRVCAGADNYADINRTPVLLGGTRLKTHRYLTGQVELGRKNQVATGCRRPGENVFRDQTLSDCGAEFSLPFGYARLVDEWVTGIGLRREDYGTHSLRRTKAALIYKQTGKLRAVQILLGHTKIESTVRYLGVDIEDALALAEGTEV